MKILAISDFHGSMEVLKQLVSAIEIVKPDAITFSGDVVKGYARDDEWLEAKRLKHVPNREKPDILEERKEDLLLYTTFYTTIEESDTPCFVVPGNMDAPEKRFRREVMDKYESSKLVNVVHGRSEVLDDVAFTGYGGEITETDSEDYFVLQYPRKVVEGYFDSVEVAEKEILLFHSPPCGPLEMDGGSRKGAQVVNDIIERRKPSYAFVGHAHPAKGKQVIGRTSVINPGALKSGNFALVDTRIDTVRFEKLDI